MSKTSYLSSVSFGSKVSQEPEKNRSDMPYSASESWKAAIRDGLSERSPGMEGSVGGSGSDSASPSVPVGWKLDRKEDDAGDMSVGQTLEPVGDVSCMNPYTTPE